MVASARHALGSPRENSMSETSSAVSTNAKLRRRGRIALLLGVPLALAIWGVAYRVTARAALANGTEAAAIPSVATVRPGQSPATEDLTLPGSVQAYVEAPIYARTSGYLKTWYTDIGTPVKKGQVLAEND